MKSKLTLLFALLMMPAIAFAHDEEVLFVPLVLLISIIGFLTFILLVKAKTSFKLILTGVYLGTLITAFWYINMIPYRENVLMINMILAFSPMITLGLALILRIGLKSTDQTR